MGEMKIRRGGVYMAWTLAFSIIWLCLGLISSFEGDVFQAVLGLAMGGLLAFSALWAFKTPYAIMSDVGISVWLAPLRRPRTVRWDAVSGVSEWPQTIEVAVSGERVLRLHLSNVAKAQRDDLRDRLRDSMHVAARV